MNYLSPETEEWLTLSEAARRLQVHPTTLRRWADNGDIPVLLTPGGHRRFAASDVARFARERHGRKQSRDAIENLWADRALVQTRQEIVGQEQQEWLVHLDDALRAEHRRLGRQLLGLTLQYLSAGDDDTRLLAEAHKIGEQYGQLELRCDLPLRDALAAALFFRDTLVETALQLPENTHIRPEANARLLRRINSLLNAVQLAIAEVYSGGSGSIPGEGH